ncbi:MAG: S46 family peptidase, partial [Gemmatimonadota bacterium]
LLVDGFYAETREEERVCPGLFLDQLAEIEDVTERVQGAAPEDAPATEIAAAQEAEREDIEDECEAESDYSCQVVSLFHGGQYQLYKYRRFQPVKLVFAPELQAGFFGGDPDNFTYPRYALDATFVRAYQPDGETAASSPQYFPWRVDAVDEGELLFVTGNPGSTSRQIAVSQWMYEAAFRHPFYIDLFEAQQAYLQDVARQDPQRGAAVRNQLFGIENSLKLYRGQLGGLRDTLLVARKIKWENQIRDAMAADPALRARYGGVFDSLAVLQARKLELEPRLNLANAFFLGTPHLTTAAALAAVTREMTLPAGEQAENVFGQPLDRVRGQALTPELPPMEAAEVLLRRRLEMAGDWLEPDDPLYTATFATGGVDEALERLQASATGLADTGAREAILEGGLDVLRADENPYLRMAVVMDSLHRALSPEWEELNAAESVQHQRFAKLLFEVFGTDIPPDATFTLRIADGLQLSYPYNGTIAAPFTTFYGLYERALAFDNEDPFTLPASFEGRQGDIDLGAQLNFVSTNDITGGNSGSPVIDRDGRIVGLAFDGNVEQLPNEFLFRPDSSGRTVAVSTHGLTEALRNVYMARALLQELLDAAER